MCPWQTAGVYLVLYTYTASVADAILNGENIHIGLFGSRKSFAGSSGGCAITDNIARVLFEEILGRSVPAFLKEMCWS